jgi:hypothetical protein
MGITDGLPVVVGPNMWMMLVLAQKLKDKNEREFSHEVAKIGSCLSGSYILEDRKCA